MSRGGSGEIVVLARGLGRAVGGALIFSLPMLMTMEMWQLGTAVDRPRLVLLLIINLPLLVALSRHVGFERTSNLREDIRDALMAYGIGVLFAAGGLAVFGVIGPGMPLDEIAGKVAIQAMPASFGALLGRSQLGGAQPGEEGAGADASYSGELFLMAVGALFLSLNVAPTEEMVLISYLMTEWHAIAMVAASLIVMHGFIYSLGFAGTEALPEGTSGWQAFIRFTLVGYAIALLISLYALWTFGRTDGAGLEPVLMSAIVLAFPAAVGAAAARLIL